MWSDVGVLVTPTLSGGSWEADLPLTNLQDRRLHRIARSSSAAVTNTVFTADLGTDRAVRCVALVKHNLSEAGTVRARGFLNEGAGGGIPALDSLDFSTGWSTTNTPTLVAASYDGSGADGVPLDLIGDDDAAAVEGYIRTVTFSGNGGKLLSFRVKQDTSTTTRVRIRDNTAGADVLRCHITWSGTVPTVTMAVGTLGSSTLIGDGVYRIVVRTATVTAANSNEVGIFPAYDAAATVALTGTIYAGDFLAFNGTPDRLAYDSGYTLAHPAGTTAETCEGMQPTWLAVTDEDKTARYWRFNIADTANTDGYVDIGRLIVAGGFQPSINMVYGAGLGFDNETVRETTDGGAALYDTRDTRRSLTGVLDLMPETDAYDEWFRLVMRHGKSGQMFVVYDPDDTGTRARQRSFLGVLKDLNPIEHPYHARFRTAFSVLEEL